MRLHRNDGAFVKRRRHLDEADRGSRRVRYRNGDLDGQKRVGASIEVLGILGHHGNEHVLTGAIGLDVSGGIHAHASPTSRVENDSAIDGVSVPVLDGGGQRCLFTNLEGQLVRLDDELGRLLREDAGCDEHEKHNYDESHGTPFQKIIPPACLPTSALSTRSRVLSTLAKIISHSWMDAMCSSTSAAKWVV